MIILVLSFQVGFCFVFTPPFALLIGHSLYIYIFNNNNNNNNNIIIINNNNNNNNNNINNNINNNNNTQIPAIVLPPSTMHP